MHSENNEVNLGDTAKIDDMKDIAETNIHEICLVDESNLVNEWDNLLAEESNLLDFEDRAKINDKTDLVMEKSNPLKLEVIAENDEICLMEESDGEGSKVLKSEAIAETMIHESYVIEESDLVDAWEGEEIALRFPFSERVCDVEKIAQSLSMCDYDPKFSNLTERMEIAPMQSKVEMYQRDIESLNPKTFINDALINFWQQWIGRYNIANGCDDIYQMSTFFFHTLCEKGIKIASRGVKKHGVISKKIITIPINMDKHWSLLAIINAKSVLESISSDSSALPFMIHLDSLQFHNTTYTADKIRTWLSYEWTMRTRHCGNEILLSEQNIPVHCPEGK